MGGLLASLRRALVESDFSFALVTPSPPSSPRRPLAGAWQGDQDATAALKRLKAKMVEKKSSNVAAAEGTEERPMPRQQKGRARPASAGVARSKGI